MTFSLFHFPSNDLLACFTVHDTAHLTKRLCKCDAPGLSVALIDALVWSIERNPDKPACYGNFTLRRAE